MSKPVGFASPYQAIKIKYISTINLNTVCSILVRKKASLPRVCVCM